MELETGAAQADPLAEALLPVLLHKLNNATQVLSSMNSLLTIEGGEELFREHTGQLGETSVRVDELGWLLAVLASSSGANLMLERREPRGLAIMVTLVSECLRRNGHALDAAGELPLLVPNPSPGLGGWELPWAVGTLLVHAGRELEDKEPLAWSHAFEFEVWRISSPHGSALTDLGKRVTGQLPGATFASDESGWQFSVPASWLAPPT